MTSNPSHRPTKLARLFLTCAGLCLGGAHASAQVKLHVVRGDADGDELGTDVAAAGDVNADGVPDFIAGAPRDYVGNGAGYARVYSGRDASVLHTFRGVGAYDQLGGSVAGAGDVDNDGFDDLVVQSRYTSVNDVTGRARVYSGRDGSVLHTFFGNVEAGYWATTPVAGVGDLDADGHDDVLVAEPLNSTNAGRIRVYSGATGLVLREVTGLPGHKLGSSAAAAGDVNGDGTLDFVVGGLPNFVNVIGHVWVFSGADGSLLHTFTTGSFTDAFGHAVAGTGDVNGDGFDDVLVGAPRDSTAGTETGMVRVHSGADGSVLHTVHGTLGDRWFGNDVCGAGDRDGDGFDEFMASELGTHSGGAWIFSGFDAHEMNSIHSLVSYDAFGCSIATLGDVDGDGGIDYAVGGYSADLPQTDAGAVYVFTLAPTHSTYCTATVNSTGRAGKLVGSGYGTYGNGDLVLHASRLPVNQPALLIASLTQGFAPLGNGTLCLAPHIWRAQAFATGATGSITAPVSVYVYPWYALIHPGDTWSFQMWFRDTPAGGAGSNLTNGVQCTFVN